MPGAYSSQVAENLPFDNEANSFTADNAQDAIEEAVTKPLFCTSVFMNNSLYGTQWLGFYSGIPDTRMIFPKRVIIDAITFDNTALNPDYDIEIYKNGTDLSHRVLVLEVRNQAYGSFKNLNITFEADDYLKVRYVDRGDNANDIVVSIWGRLANA